MAEPLLADLASGFIAARIWAGSGFTEIVTGLLWFDVRSLGKSCFITKLVSTQTLTRAWVQVCSYKGLKQH